MKFDLSDKEYSFIYSKSVRLCIDILIIRNKKVLMTKRGIQPYKNKWHLPGGRIKFRETIYKAIERIAKNEIGINVFNPMFIGYIEFLKEMQNGEKRHSISLVFKVKIKKTPINGKYINKLTPCLHPIHEKFLLDKKLLW